MLLWLDALLADLPQLTSICALEELCKFASGRLSTASIQAASHAGSSSFGSMIKIATVDVAQREQLVKVSAPP